MKTLFVSALLLLVLACQKERKPCKFQGIEVSCEALDEQLFLQQQAAKARAAAEKPTSTEESLPKSIVVDAELAIELKKTSFTVIESMITTTPLLTKVDTHDCSVGALNDDKASVVGDELHFRMDQKLVKLKLKERKSPTSLAGSSWGLQKKLAKVTENLLVILSPDKVKLQKTCTWKDQVPEV